jgi:hypothetical protein
MFLYIFLTTTPVVEWLACWIYYILCVCTVPDIIYHGLLWIIVIIFYVALVNTTHGFYWRWDVLHAKWHGYP